MAKLVLAALASLAPLSLLGQTIGESSLDLARRTELLTQLSPPRVSHATLSRDGNHLAYVVTDRAQTRVDIVAVAPPHQKESRFLGDTRGARVLKLAWTSPRRLVLATEDWAIATVSLDEPNPRIVLTPDSFSTALTGDWNPDAEENPLQYDRYPRPPRLLGIAPDEPDVVIVEGVVGQHLRNAITTTARLDLVSGEWREINTERIADSAMRFWADGSGRYRLRADRTRLPFRWHAREMRDNGKLRSWRTLSQTWSEELAAAFSLGRDNLWTDRALPLGFAPNADTFYYATNVGQNTFGLRAWDFDEGAPADLAFDLPQIDVAIPTDDLAPAVQGALTREYRRDNAAVFYTDFSPTPPASPLVFDRGSGALTGVRIPHLPAGTRWVDPDLAELQRDLERDHSNRHVRIQDWDDDREKFLVQVSSPASAGRYFVYHRGDRSWTEFLRRHPAASPGRNHKVTTFEIAADDGGPVVTGCITTPNTPLGRKPPLVLFLPDGPWDPAAVSRTGPAQMLAAYGCLVLELTPRGRAGNGTATLLTGRETPDASAARDYRLARAWLEDKFEFDPRRIAMVGVGYGGWLALRVAQREPDGVRSVAALDGFNDLGHLFAQPPPRERPQENSRALEQARDMMAYMDAVKRDLDRTSEIVSGGFGGTAGGPTNGGFSVGSASSSTADPFAETDTALPTSRLRIAERMRRAEEINPVAVRPTFARWYFGPNADDDREHSVKHHAAELNADVLFCITPDREPSSFPDAKAIAAALRKTGRHTEIHELPSLVWDRAIDERPETWVRVAEFFNESLINYDVQIGPTREVE